MVKRRQRTFYYFLFLYIVVRLQDSTKKKREYLPPFMIAGYFYGDEKGNIVNIIWWLSFLSNAAVYVEFVSTIINMQYKGYCLNMAQHLRLSVAKKNCSIPLNCSKWSVDSEYNFLFIIHGSIWLTSNSDVKLTLPSNRGGWILN